MFLPFIFNLKVYLGIGYYSVEDNFVNVYPEGTGGINVRLSINHQEGHQYHGIGTISTISSGNIEGIGIRNLTYSIHVNNHLRTFGNENWDPSVNSYKIELTTSLYKDDNVTLKGSAHISFEISGIPQTDTINYTVSDLILFSATEISNNWNVLLVWVEIFYIIFIIILGFAAYRIYKRIRSNLWYTEEMRKKDEEFFEVLTKKKKRKK